MLNVSDRRQLVKAIPELLQKKEPLDGETIQKQGRTYRHSRVHQFECPIDDQGFDVPQNPAHTTIGSRHSAREVSKERKLKDSQSTVSRWNTQGKNEA